MIENSIPQIPHKKPGNKSRFIWTVLTALFLTWALPGVPETALGHHLEEMEEFSDNYFEEETLTGDPQGLRTRLQDRGWVLEVEYSGNLFHNPTGGRARQTDYAGYLDLDLHGDLQRIMGWDHARFLVDLIHLHGSRPSSNLDTVQTVSSLEGPDEFKLFLAWIEQTLWDGRISLKAGVYSLDTEFDFKESANLFINGVFGTGLDISETGITGATIFPNSALGARFYIEPVDRWYFQAAVMDGVPGHPKRNAGTHTILDDDDGLQIAAESGYQTKLKGDRLGKVAFGSLVYTTRLPDLVDRDALGNPVFHSGTFSVYGFIDWPVTFEEHDPAQGANLFFRVGTADPDVAHFDFTLSGGAVYTGLVPGRPKDRFGVAVSGAWSGDKFQASRGGNFNSNEWVVETSYKAKLIPGMEVQPNFQYFINPGSNPALRDALYLGLAFNLNL